MDIEFVVPDMEKMPFVLGQVQTPYLSCAVPNDTVMVQQ